VTKDDLFDAIDEHIDWGEHEETYVWPLVVEFVAEWLEGRADETGNEVWRSNARLWREDMT
jgi:hypothetical protein